MLTTFLLLVWKYSCHGQIRLVHTQTATLEDKRVKYVPGNDFPKATSGSASQLYHANMMCISMQQAKQALGHL